MPVFRGLIYLLVAGLAAPVSARSPTKEVVNFSISNDVGLGISAYVAGSHPDLGSWEPTEAVKLRYTPGNIWTARVAVQSGTPLEYKFIVRNDSQTGHCDIANVTWPTGSNLVYQVPSQPDAPYVGKTVFYHSSWTQALLLGSTDGVNFTNTTMSHMGPGRTPGEFLYQAEAVGEPGAALQFVLHNGEGDFDLAPYPGGYGAGSDYFTELDTFFLQDGNLFNYTPPASISPSRVETSFVGSSWAPDIPARDVKVYLPRGYDENTWRRYPVVYMHDGQNIFWPDVGLGGSWDANRIADQEISQGRMRECVIVGIPSRANGEDRVIEYLPPQDEQFGRTGVADLYANFLIHNVRPFIDATYRTLNDRPNTFTLGSSMGGLVSVYLGMATNVYSQIGVFSPATYTATNYISMLATNLTPDLRIYLDAGDLEGPRIWDYTWYLYRDLLAGPYTMNQDLLMVIGCGDDHNEVAWARRLPRAFRYLLSPWDEPNLLAQVVNPPRVVPTSSGVQADTLHGYGYILEKSPTLKPPAWDPVQTSAVETLPWSSRELTDPVPLTGAESYYRVLAEPRP